MFYLIYIYNKPKKFNIFLFLFVILVIVFAYFITIPKKKKYYSRYHPIYSDLPNTDLDMPSNRLINIYGTKYGKRVY